MPSLLLIVTVFVLTTRVTRAVAGVLFRLIAAAVAVLVALMLAGHPRAKTTCAPKCSGAIPTGSGDGAPQ